jgi:hypothetical protein
MTTMTTMTTMTNRSEHKRMRQRTAFLQRDDTTVDASITIHRAGAEVYCFYRDFTNLPRFLGDVMVTEPLGPRCWLWTIQGPLGIRVKWPIRVTAHGRVALQRNRLDPRVAHPLGTPLPPRIRSRRDGRARADARPTREAGTRSPRPGGHIPGRRSGGESAPVAGAPGARARDRHELRGGGQVCVVADAAPPCRSCTVARRWRRRHGHAASVKSPGYDVLMPRPCAGVYGVTPGLGFSKTLTNSTMAITE